MIETYLFDWGDTLMVDFPKAKGKMCDWKKVEAMPGATHTLKYLSKRAEIYVATNAADSTESDIEKAFMRVNMNLYISGFFCKNNIGIAKGSPEYYESILTKLEKEASRVAMVGDSLEKDIIPASRLGIKTYWLSSEPESIIPIHTTRISRLSELCTLGSHLA